MIVRRAACSIVTLAIGFAATSRAADLKHRWILDSDQIKDQSVTALSGQTGTLAAAPKLDPSGLLLFDSTQSLSAAIPEEKATFWLPVKSFTAEAWVKIDKPIKWGGIVGYQQDNGSNEKGWVLGYANNHFFFKVSNGPLLHTTTAANPFTPGKWHHVVGTYDGTTLRLYLDGALEASSTACSGDIEYPPDAPFAIGAYHDKDEHFPLTGQIREVRLYEGTLTADTITAHLTWARNLPDRSLQFTVPPSLLYTSATTAEVTWESEIPGTGLVEWTSSKGDSPMVMSRLLLKKSHLLQLSDLHPQTEYQIRVGVQPDDDETLWAPPFTIDTTFNFAPPALTKPKKNLPGPAQTLANSAFATLRTSPRDGFCLLLDARDTDLPEALARAGNLRVIALSTDTNIVTQLRQKAYAAGTYGERLTFLHVPDLTHLPFTADFANLIVATDSLPLSENLTKEITRVLHPSGGVAYLAGPGSAKVITREPSPDSGTWSHQYGDSGNSAFAGESLGGARSTEDLVVQWIGRPGADFGIDRNPRMPAPLAVNGRLFHQGLNRIVALDSHHGTPLWTLEAPDLRRVNIPRDASNWCADPTDLFVAVKDRAWTLDAATGHLKNTLAVPSIESGAAYEWGYIANDESRIYGSAVAEGSSYRAFWTSANWFDQLNAESTAKVCSESLFAYAKSDRDLLWHHTGGIIINTSITLHEGRLYFAENRNPELLVSKQGRISSDALWKNLHLVCLDASSGTLLWQRPIESTVGQVVFFLQAAENQILLTTSAKSVSGRGEYLLQTFSVENGSPGWTRPLPWRSADHGAHMQHPVIVGGKVYVEPHAVDFHSGEIVSDKVRPREGCSTAMASANAIFLRGTGRCLTVWSPETESPTHWPRLRPSCWLNMVAAQGLLLIPEGGAGCSCGGWMESSMAFRPLPK